MSVGTASGTSVLFDAPGPKARLRNHILSALTVVAIVAIGWFAFRAFDEKGQLTADKWSPFLDSQIWTTYLLPGVRGTVVAAVLSIVFALVLGMVLGVGRLSDHRAVRWIAGLIVEVSRAIPVLILMIFLNQIFHEYKVFKTADVALAAVVTALTIYNGSVIAEIVRSGIRSLPKGQSEAAVALGMRKGQLMRLILLPQAVTSMLPALISQMVVALKDSALGYLIGYLEVVRQAKALGALEGNIIPALIVVGVIVIVLNNILSTLATRVEQRLRSRKGGKGGTTVVGVDAIIEDATPGMDITKKS
jgi:glutamate transport system permease protein